MTWTAPGASRQSAPYVAGEREMLDGWLDFHRQTLLAKCAGLTADQLKEAAAPRKADMSVRWVYLHMVEEYARHNGHADLLRERIDGTTGT